MNGKMMDHKPERPPLGGGGGSVKQAKKRKKKIDEDSRYDGTAD